MNPILFDTGDGGRLLPPSAPSDIAATLAGIQSQFRQEADWEANALIKAQRAWTRSHLQTADIAQVKRIAERARKDFSALVTVGIGGSDLSARVFNDTLNYPYHNLLSSEGRGGSPEVYFTGDTFDPYRLNGLLTMLKSRCLLGKTLFNVISKSGKTGETIAATMIIRDALQRELGGDAEAWRKQVLATTGLNDKSVLWQFHQKSPFYDDLMPVPDGVGGRFSAFSPVGLFFLAMTGGSDAVDSAIVGVRDAAALFETPCGESENVSYQLAKWLHLAEVSGKTVLVFYNYADNARLGDWFVQLYEESIQERGGGLNVLAAKGPTSNHSILNGILGGPRDKSVLFVYWEDMGTDLEIPRNTGIGGDLEAFEGLPMSGVQTASYLGTAAEFTAKGVPNVTLRVRKRDAHHLFYLMRVLMDTVAVKGRLQGLHINDAGAVSFPEELTYHQHGVEGYKIRTVEYAKKMRGKQE